MKEVVFLFTVGAFNHSSRGLGLLPGVRLDRASEPGIKDLREGAVIELRRPDGSTLQSRIEAFYVEAFAQNSAVLISSTPHIVVALPRGFCERDAPVGTEIYRVLSLGGGDNEDSHL